MIDFNKMISDELGIGAFNAHVVIERLPLFIYPMVSHRYNYFSDNDFMDEFYTAPGWLSIGIGNGLSRLILDEDGSKYIEIIVDCDSKWNRVKLIESILFSTLDIYTGKSTYADKSKVKNSLENEVFYASMKYNVNHDDGLMSRLESHMDMQLVEYKLMNCNCINQLILKFRCGHITKGCKM